MLSCMDLALDFLFDKYEYTHRMFQSAILVSTFMLQIYLTFSLRFDWQNQFLFSEKNFSEKLVSYWLLAPNVTSFFQWKIGAFTWIVLCTLVNRNYGGKLSVSIKCCNLCSYKEGVTLLCQNVSGYQEYQISLAQHSFHSSFNELFTNWKKCSFLRLLLRAA